MYIGYTEEQEALRSELRSYYENLLTPEVVRGLHEGQGTGEVMRSVVKQMGAGRMVGRGLAAGIRRPWSQPDRAIHLV